MEGAYIGWAVLAAFFFISLYMLIAKESKALRRDESARDPMFGARPMRAGKRSRVKLS